MPDWLNQYKEHTDTGTNTNNKKYADTSIQTDKEEPITSISVATYLNIRKRLDELQHQQKLENQRSIGINTDIVEININSQFDETVWLNPHKTPTWADYKTQSEPSLDSVELAVLRVRRHIIRHRIRYSTRTDPRVAPNTYRNQHITAAMMSQAQIPAGQ